MQLVTKEAMLERLQTIYTSDELEMPNEKYRALVLDGLRFHGAANEVCAEIHELLGVKKAVKVAQFTSKSWATDYLMLKHNVPLYWAHNAMNTITHYNLRPVAPEGHTEFENESFYLLYLQFMAEHRQVLDATPAII